ncbi:MAG: mrgA [Bacteroidota bacterium]|jgi:starvation-inducible DNA-binding protein|nr:mrgA [Bacteroidota bacterium]
MKPRIGIPEKKLQYITDLLSVVFANQVTLYTKTLKFHWNVCGENLMELHKLFKHQYTLLESSIDETAERISKLGAKTIGTMAEFTKHETIAWTLRRYLI